MKSDPLQTLLSIVFTALVLVTIAVTWHVSSNIQIDTNLADLSPTNQYKPQTKAASTALASSIEKRAVLLLRGRDENTLFDAELDLRERLAGLSELSVLPSGDQQIEDLLGQLKPYRFSLLSSEQRDTLASSTAVEIAEQARLSLYKLSGQTRVYSFKDDPLGWHSATLIALMAKSGVAGDRQSDTIQALPVYLKINEGALNITTQQSLTGQLDEQITQVEDQYSITVDRSGIFFFAAYAAKTSRQDISFISMGSTIGVVLLLLFVFRSFRALLLPVVSIGLGVGFAFVVTHLIYGKVHILTIVFGASLIGIVIDYSLHYFYHGAQRDRGNDSEKRSLFRALGLSLMTSIIGYAALSFSGLQALEKVAVFSCCGLSMAWLSVICLGDLALRKPISIDQSLIPQIAGNLVKTTAYVSQKSWSILAGLVILAAALIIVLADPFNDDPRVFFKAPQHLLDSERRVAEIANDYEPGRYLIIQGSDTAQVYQRHKTLFHIINQSKELRPENFTSLLSWIPAAAQQKRDYLQQAKLYASNGAAQSLLQAFASDSSAAHIQAEYRAAYDRQLTPDLVSQMLGEALPPFWFRSPDSIVNFVLVRKGTNADALESLVAELDGVEYINTLQRTQLALTEQRVSAATLLLLAYLLVSVLIVLRYRRLSALKLVLVPICASAMLIVLSTAFGFSLNLFHIMALFLVLGFGMDYTIFATEMKAHQNTTLQAILLSAVTSLLSFGLLGLSAIPLVASFGITLLVGNTFNLLGAIIYAQGNRR